MTEPDSNVLEPDPPRMDSPHTIITHSLGCCEQISFLLWANYIELTTTLSIKRWFLCHFTSVFCIITILWNQVKSITSLILQQGSIVVTSPQLLLLCQTSSLTPLPSSHDPSTTGLCESILSSSNYDDKNLFNQNDIFRFPQALWHGAHFQRIYSCFSFVIPISCHRNTLLWPHVQPRTLRTRRNIEIQKHTAVTTSPNTEYRNAETQNRDHMSPHLLLQDPAHYLKVSFGRFFFIESPMFWSIGLSYDFWNIRLTHQLIHIGVRIVC